MTCLRDRRIDLAARQLAAFTGLRALCHLDLNLARVDQVLAGDAETSRGNLLDGRVLRVAVLEQLETLGVFAAFARVALAADAVHRDRQRLVCFLADRAVRHCAGLEALHDAFDRLDFFERNGIAGLELQQAAQRAQVRRLFVDELRIFLERVEVLGPHALLQAMDRLGIEQMELAVRAPLIQTADRQRMPVDAAIREGRLVTHEHFLRDHVHADAADTRRRPREVLVDDVLTQAHRFEHLRAAIALDRGDAHLGHDLDDALGRGLDQVLARSLVIDVDEAIVANHAVDRFERDVWVDRARAVTDEQCEVMHFARLAGFDDDADAGTQTFANQIVMEARDREQCRNRRELTIDATIAQDEDVHFLFLDQSARHQANFFHRLHQAFLAARDAEEGRQHADTQARQIHAADLGEVFVGDDRPLELEAAAIRGLRIQQVAFRAQACFGRGDDLFTDRIDRRIRDLREQLLEIVIEQARFVRQHRKRRVVAHGAHRLDAVLRHRCQQQAFVFEGVAEGDLSLQQRVVIGLRHFRRLGQIGNVELMIVQPFAIGALGRDGFLDLGVVDDAALLGVHQEHPTGLQAALLHDVFGRHFEHTGFGRHDDDAVLGDVVTGRAQTIAIEQCADLLAVGEADGCGTVPRLHQARVVLIEGALRIVHGLMIRPGFGNHHHHGVRQRATREHQKLERVVEHGRVGAIRIDDRQDLADVIAEGFRLEQRFARMHPVRIAANRVDLAVVRDVAVRMSAIPARERVRAEARVDERDCGLHRRIAQIGEVLLELRRQQHAFVDQRLVREARDVPGRGAFHRRCADLAVGALADHIELALERELIFDLRIAADEHLAHERLAGLGRLAKHRIVGGDRAPAEDRLAFGLHDLLELFFDAATQGRVAGQKDDAAAVVTFGGQIDACLLGRDLQELVRHLEQYASAVAGVDLGAAGAAMVQVGQDLQTLFEDLM